ncbi:hypothetical protein [Spirosoma arboris]|nr:hypothetical protein [Spirosoma arboris]
MAAFEGTLNTPIRNEKANDWTRIIGSVNPISQNNQNLVGRDCHA